MGEMNLADSKKSMANPSTVLTNICTCCSQPAGQTCNGCADARILNTEQSSNTFYCSTSCDWEIHKKVCKLLSARKRLCRAGDIVQRIFYLYREHTLEKLLTKVKKVDNTLYLYEGVDYGAQILVPFPHRLFSCEENKLAALTYAACGDAVGFMRDIVRLILKGKHPKMIKGPFIQANAFDDFKTGLYLHIDEASTEIRQKPMTTRHVDQNRKGDTPTSRHCCFRVQLRTDEVYAFDLSGAQFGYRETVSPWESYLQLRGVRDSEESIEFGPFGSTLNALHGASNGLGLFAVTMKCNLWFTNAVSSACEDFGGAEGHVPLSEMVKLPQKAYEHHRTDLLTFSTKALEVFNAEAKKRFRATAMDLMYGSHVHVI